MSDPRAAYPVVVSEHLVVEALIASSQEEALAELVGAYQALGAHLVPVGSDRLRAAVYLEPQPGDVVAALVQACANIGGECITVNVEPAQDWLAAYRALARPFAVGRTWWIEPDPNSRTCPPAGRRRLTVEPRMAFGTGSHESTHLVLLELEDDPPVGMRFLDIGAGSGILALAAHRLGAAWTLGFDIDLQAVFVARQIAKDQDFPCDVRFIAGPIAAVANASFDRVACNMVAAQFMPIAEDIRRVLDAQGTVTFSGILQTEEHDVRHELEKHGLRTRRARHLGEWVALQAGHA